MFTLYYILLEYTRFAFPFRSSQPHLPTFLSAFLGILYVVQLILSQNLIVSCYVAPYCSIDAAIIGVIMFMFGFVHSTFEPIEDEGNCNAI